MAKANEYEKRTQELLEPILLPLQFELVDVEYVKEGGSYFLRAYIDKPGGITIDDCETVSRALSDELDKYDFIDDAYILEVSSPGLGRPLKKDKDFVRHMGEEVDLKLYRAAAGSKEHTGTLKGFDAESVEIEINNEICRFERKNIAMIRLAFDF